MKHFDVIVVGGGHAGLEAALAAARRGAETALVTFRRSDLGVMSCNPAIGGIGKGHLVREIDALDGMMGLAADHAGIQYRLLNRSRGPAVQGPRVQADRRRYADFAQRHVAGQERLTVLEGEVVDFHMDSARVAGVVLADGMVLSARAVVLTTGTFLRGEIHIGTERLSAGRRGAEAADRLGARLREMATGIGRLKTGTPARLDGRTIDWDRVDRQEGDADPVMMSFLNRRPEARQIACGVTETNPRTHEIIERNLHLSAMRSGNITGVGPRYCPSVEDKVTRFADKTSHNVFLEPEGLDDDTIYPNGISTSLPREVQEAFLRSIVGLETVGILHFGYAIEYDYLDPRGLTRSLEVQAMPGLFLAGQINGTTGYEEAGAQGLLAGANAAAAALDMEPLTLSRFDSYIGVMIDDLVTRGVSEPYRMFTSRAEYRLTLRADNADQRLTQIGASLGLVSDHRKVAFEDKIGRLAATAQALEAEPATPSELDKLGISVPKDGQRRSWRFVAGHLLGLHGNSEGVGSRFPDLRDDDVVQVARETFYEPYVARQAREAEQLRREGGVVIPTGLDFSKISSLSSELRLKLAASRPATLAEAGSIEGMTPAALTAILAHLKVLQQAARVAIG
ncbi:tRNA uridine-5-carboxymethylaminomethyl(34) synthesis enzyme MnmG [Pararhodobacter aggregans]|uniref:tRNA uridine 5-carboxymethylaminomethyl modification enzyme MnmG n=1 Tax=Pararhodobacter aggregans TaxID=404875 RepID=A0A2T7ULE3_9RHOB|nr:tRNA uridine-5-carboxymethylaminomethyl(34) synthesis enzyme MnmG [Pararhodobacter aggregans]PTW99762.1 tRNA uridine 5-carboxymethylaminomethyl modification enzyme [Pararhodobacter aggregans]PVE45469.1 tRNA uridine-5-carboxymethylaminomethyl(34) synthesis enzyme MnmG [Pararhodobacter aggregans]